MVAKAGLDIPGIQGSVPLPGSPGQRLIAYSSTRASKNSGVWVYDVTDERGNKQLPKPQAKAISFEDVINDTASFTLLVALKGAAEAWSSAAAGTVGTDVASAGAAEATFGVGGTAGEAIGVAEDICDIVCVPVE